MKETQNLLLTLTHNACLSAELLRDALLGGCAGCICDISDLNRHTLLELSEFEQLYLDGIRSTEEQHALYAAHALLPCITQAFSASMLIPLENGLPSLSPLCEMVSCHVLLAAGLESLLPYRSSRAHYPESLRLHANKSRGAQALLLTNYCSTEGGSRHLPLILSLEAHRNALETAIGALLLLNTPSETKP